MNLSTVALILLACHLMSSNSKPPKTQQSPPMDWTGFLSEDTKNIINCVGTLSNEKCSQEDRTGAIFQMLSNPAIMNLASNLFGNFGAATAPDKKENDTDGVKNQHTSRDDVNSEGFRFDTPSDDSREFFRPIDNIADSEIKHKLYWFYDNWYVK